MQRMALAGGPQPDHIGGGSQTVERNRPSVCILREWRSTRRTESDLPALLPLLRGYCDFYGASPSDDGLTAMVRALIAAQDADGMLLVARGGDGRPDRLRDRGLEVVQPAGRANRRDGGPVRVPEARGQGAADALIRACADRAREHGAPVLIWETALDNHRAQAVYERVGATGDAWLEYELELG